MTKNGGDSWGFAMRTTVDQRPTAIFSCSHFPGDKMERANSKAELQHPLVSLATIKIKGRVSERVNGVWERDSGVWFHIKEAKRNWIFPCLRSLHCPHLVSWGIACCTRYLFTLFFPSRSSASAQVQSRITLLGTLLLFSFFFFHVLLLVLLLYKLACLCLCYEYKRNTLKNTRFRSSDWIYPCTPTQKQKRFQC